MPAAWLIERAQFLGRLSYRAKSGYKATRGCFCLLLPATLGGRGSVLAKKSGGGAIGAIVLVGLGMLAAVPKEAWITIGVIAFGGWMLYLFFGSKKSSPSSSTKAP